MVDDVELLRRYARERSEASFAELVQRHLDLVYAAALRQVGGGTHRAQDVVQIVFTDLARKAAALSQRTEIVGWLYTSTHFAAAKLKRSELRRQRREQEAHLMNELSSSANPAWEDIQAVLDDAMLDLNEREREAILMRYFQGRRLAEIGRKINLTEDAVRMRVDRALEKLRMALAKRHVTSTASALGLLLANQPVVAVPAGLAATVIGTAMATGGVLMSALNVFLLMSQTKLAISVAGIVAILAMGTATQQALARRELVATFNAADQTTDRAYAELKQTERQARTTEEDVASLKKAVSEKSGALAAAQEKKAAEWDPVTEGRLFLERHPEVKAALIEQKNAELRLRYAPLYQRLGLDHAQIEEFQTLMRTTFYRADNPESKKQLMFPYGPDLDPREFSDRLRQLLGGEGYQIYVDFKRTAVARELTAKIAADLSQTATPLSLEQARQLVQILANVRAHRGNVEWDEVAAKAAPLLSSGQFAALEGVRADDEWQRAMARWTSPSRKASSQP